MSESTEKKSIYTTIQVRRDINTHIRKICKERGWLASTLTENFWLGVISSSMSGSYQAGV
jgi:hypothetical protein